MTATIEPRPGFWVKEFVIDGLDPKGGTYYVDDDSDLLGKIAEQSARAEAGVAVVLGDDGPATASVVRVSYCSLEPWEALTRAAEAILRVRDQLLKMHGYADMEEYHAHFAAELSRATERSVP